METPLLASALQGIMVEGYINREQLYLSRMNSFTANTAVRGGAKHLANSFILLSRNTTITMNNNSATEYVGALYAEDSNPITYCSSEYPDNNILWDKYLFETYELFEVSHVTPSIFVREVTAYYNIYIHLYNNHALNAGSAVYNGSVDICYIPICFDSTTSLGSAVFDCTMC